MYRMILLTALLAVFAFPALAGTEGGTPTGRMRFDVEMMHPMRGASQSVSDGYGVEVSADSAWVCLPYRGVVHTPMMDGDGLNFDQPMPITHTWTERVYNRRNKYKYSVLDFNCRRRMVTYEFRIRIYPNGRASIRVRPSNADPISFDARCEAQDMPSRASER